MTILKKTALASAVSFQIAVFSVTLNAAVLEEVVVTAQKREQSVQE